MTFKPLIAAAALGLAAVSGAASADTGNVAHVRYGDLDLKSDAGRHAFANRLNGALNKVCGVADAGNRLMVTSCRNDAGRDAREQMRKVVAAAF